MSAIPARVSLPAPPVNRVVKAEFTMMANLVSITFLAIGILTGNPILLGIGITSTTLTMGLNGYHIYNYIKNRKE